MLYVHGLRLHEHRLVRLVERPQQREVRGGQALQPIVDGARGVQCLAFAERRLRLVTHLDVDRAACERAASALESIVRG